jgi:quinohemoprotein amine dehydrogenase alpha subunit-like protein
MTFTGRNFVVGSTQVSVTAGLVGAGVTGESTTSIAENVQITPGTPLGDAEFAVTTGVAHSDPLVFTVLPPAPTLTNVTPSAAARGATVAVTLTGTNFIAGATTVSVNGIGVTTNTIVVTSGTSLTVNIVIAADAPPGVDPISVTTAGGASGAQPFIVDPSAPLTNRTPKRS